MGEKVSVSVRMPQHTVDQIEQAADQSGTDRSTYIRKAVLRRLHRDQLGDEFIDRVSDRVTDELARRPDQKLVEALADEVEDEIRGEIREL